jgi:hypothetical protein
MDNVDKKVLTGILENKGLDPDFMLSHYEKRSCQGMCAQIDDIGLCIGVCNSGPEAAQATYDHAKERTLKAGKGWFDMPKFENNSIIPTRKINADPDGLKGFRKG